MTRPIPVVVVFALIVFATASVHAATQPPFQIWTGQQGRGEAFNVEVAHTDSDWRHLWRAVGRSEPPTALIDGHVGVAVRLAPRRTSGYKVEIIGVAPSDHIAFVHYRIVEPKTDAFLPMVLTSPWAIATFPLSNLPIAFRTESDQIIRIPMGQLHGFFTRRNAAEQDALAHGMQMAEHCRDQLESLENELNRCLRREPPSCLNPGPTCIR